MNESSAAPRKAAIYLRISQDREMDGLAIDRQLYEKYGLNDEEIAFIESHVKEMD